MALLDIRQRTGWLFVAVMVGHIILISAQVNTAAACRLLEAVTFGAFAEVQRGATTVIGGVRTSWHDYVALQQVRRRTSELQRGARAAAGAPAAGARAGAAVAHAAAAARAARRRRSCDTMAANVIAGGASPDFRTVTIDKGTAEACGRTWRSSRRPASSAAIIMPSARAAKVQLLIDRNAAAGALIERTRAQGVVVGTGGEPADGVRVRDGRRQGRGPRRDLRHRRHLPEGLRHRSDRISRAGRGEFSAIVIRPAVDFSSLEAVLVVVTPPRGGRRGRCPVRCGSGTRVKAFGVLIAIALALALQTTLARFLVGGTGGARSGARRRWSTWR